MTTIRTLKKTLGIERAATFRHFLNGFAIDGITDRGEVIADSRVSDSLTEFFILNRYFLKLYEEDYYEDKDPALIAKRIRRGEEEVLNYFKTNSPHLFINGIYSPPKLRPLRYCSSYRLDWKLGGNYEFLLMTRNSTLKENSAL